MRRNPAKSTWRRILWAAVVTLAALALLEMTAGIVWKQIRWRPTVVQFDPASEFHNRLYFQKDRLLFWRLRPGQILRGGYMGSRDVTEGIRISRLGFRGDDFPPQPAAGVVRIVFMGDSLTFGFRVKDTETYPYLFKKKFDRLSISPLPIEVINAGVPGYSTLQGLRYLKGDVLPLRPHIVLLAFGANDQFQAFGGDDRTYAESQLASSTGPKRPPWLTRFYLVRFIAAGIRELKFKPGGSGTRVSEADTRANLIAMIKLCRDAHVEVVLLPDGRGENHVEAGKRMHAPVIDLRPPEFERLRDQLSIPDDGHPNAAGYRVIAEYLVGLPEIQQLIVKVAKTVRAAAEIL